MCYPLPGPRCSSHARKALVRAYRAYETEPNGSPRKQELFEEYQSKRKDFFATPAGQQWLEDQIAETGDPNGTLEEERLEGARNREAAMQAMRTSGQVPSIVHEEINTPEDLQQLRHITQFRKRLLSTAEEEMVRARDAFEHAEATDSADLPTKREELRRATNAFTRAYEGWTLAFEEVDAAEAREEA